MANIGRPIISLCLAAQDGFHDLRTHFFVDNFFEYRVECLGLNHLTKRKFDVKSFEIFLQRHQLFAAWRFMRAINQRRLLGFQRLGRGDIGGDHKVFDQTMRFQLFALSNTRHPALIVKRNALFR